MQAPGGDPSPDVYRSCAEEALSAVLGEFDSFDVDDRQVLLGYVAVTRFLLGDSDSAHKTLQDPLLQSDSDARFRAWQLLVAEGDTASIPKARAAMANSSENLMFTETYVDSGGINSAEKMVGLVSAGDEELLPLARKAANNVYLKKRSDLLSILYTGGDQVSLDLALIAIEDAREADEAIAQQLREEARTQGKSDYQHIRYTQNSTWGEMNLDEMFSYALKQNKIEDARKVLEHYVPAKRYDRLLDIYVAGDTDVYQEIIVTTKDDLKGLNATTIALARGGDAQSQIRVRKLAGKEERKLLEGKLSAPEAHSRSDWEKLKKNEKLRRNLYKGLAALHSIGDDGIEERILNCVEHDNDFEPLDIYIFEGIDMDTTKLYRLVYQKSTDGFRDTVIFTIGFSKELFTTKLKEGIQKVKDDRHAAAEGLGQLMSEAARQAKATQV